MRVIKVALLLSAVLAGIVFLYPFLVWVYCLADDFILHQDGGRWEFEGSTFWHSYYFGDGSSPQYDRQIDLSRLDYALVSCGFLALVILAMFLRRARPRRPQGKASPKSS